MTARDGATPAADAVQDGWRACLPELTIAAILISTTCTAVYLYAGLRAAVLALTGWALAALVLVRCLLPARHQLFTALQPWRSRGHSSFTGFWRKRGMLTDAMASQASYDHELRFTLQHLLAARLAERHGVSLYADPVAARALFLDGAHDDELWEWLDPHRPVQTDQQKRGIPPRTLSAIINRLERL